MKYEPRDIWVQWDHLKVVVLLRTLRLVSHQRPDLLSNRAKIKMISLAYRIKYSAMIPSELTFCATYFVVNYSTYTTILETVTEYPISL